LSGELLLGIDLGTTLIKAIIFTSDGVEVGSSEREVQVDYPRPGWAEQDPEMLWRVTASVIREALNRSHVDPSEIAGVSLTGQMHGTFLIDDDGRPARPKAIIWLDSRSKNILREYYDRNLADRIYDITGWRLITSMQLMHLLWLKENESKVLERTRIFMACKDYIRYRLTGVPLTDLTDASVTGLMDIRNGVWSEEILELTGIPTHILPEIKVPWECAGEVTEEAARITGLKAGTPVAVGAGDICSTALGAGVVNPGQLTAIIGTAGVYELAVDEIVLDKERKYSVAYHAVPGRWLLATFQMTAGAALRWFKDEFCYEERVKAKEKGVTPYVLMDEEAASSPVGANGIIFHPFLQGERSPFVNPDARGILFGLGLWSKRRDVIRAILEGVALAARDNVELFKKKGLKIKEVRLTGGGAKSPLWSQILTDVLGVKLVIPKVKDCGALGSAIEAGVVSRVFKDPYEGVERMIRVEKEYRPNSKNVEKYEKLFRLYRRLYEKLWEMYEATARTYSEL